MYLARYSGGMFFSFFSSFFLGLLSSRLWSIYLCAISSYVSKSPAAEFCTLRQNKVPPRRQSAATNRVCPGNLSGCVKPNQTKSLFKPRFSLWAELEKVLSSFQIYYQVGEFIDIGCRAIPTAICECPDNFTAN
jgi:hypothetical protein